MHPLSFGASLVLLRPRIACFAPLRSSPRCSCSRGAPHVQVVIDCFRSINPQLIMLGQEPRQTTSNVGHLHKPSIQALIHGLNRHYYSIALSYRKNELEQQMLMNLHKKNW